MNAWLSLQYALIALAVVVSAWVVANKQFPGAVRRLRVALALQLLRDGKPAWMRGLGKRIAPASTIASDGCGGCDNCGPTP